MRFKVLGYLLFCLLCFKTATAQLTVNVAAGGDVVGASYQVLQAGGGTINLAAGNYYIGTSIVMGPNTTINGAGGPGSTTQTVIYAPASPNGIAMVTQAYAGASNLTLSNLVLDGNIPQAAMLYGTGNGNYAYNDTGIYFYDQSATTVGVTLTNIEVRHTLRGILTGLVDNLTISGCYFHDNNPGGFSHNMYLVATSGVEIDHTRSDNALTGDGLHIDFGGYFYTIRKSEFSGNNGLGILSQQDNSVTVEDSQIDFNTNDGIQIDAGGLLLTRDQLNHNGGYGFNIPDTADGNGQVNGVYTLGDGATDYFYQASINDFTIYGPPANTYPAVQATGVTGVVDTADWTLNYPGYTYMGAVDFNANHLTNGTITFPYVGATVEGTPGSGTGNYPLVFRYSNGTSSAQTMNVSVNGGVAVALSFPPTGSYSSWNTVTMNAILNVGNSTVTMSVPAGATSAPEIDTLTVTTLTPNAPNAPTNLTGTAPSPYSVTLNWTAPTAGNNNAAQTYTVYRNGGLIADRVVGTTYTDTRIFYGESTNSYFVVAANQAGTSGGSNTVTVTTGIDAPPGLQVGVSPGVPSNNLNWLGVSGAANYLVKRSTVSGGPYQTVATIPATTGFPGYSDTSLAIGTNYFYVVAAVDAGGNVSANSYEVTALAETFTLSASSNSVNLSSITPDTISVIGTNGFHDAVNFSVTGLPAGVTASLSATSGSSTQITFTANTSAAQGSYPVTVMGTDGGLSSSVGITVVVSSGQLAQVITFNPIPQQAVGNSLAVYATASSGLPVTFSVVPNGNCSVSGNVVTFLNGGACGVLANQAGNANFSAAAQVGQLVQVGAPAVQTITFATIPTQVLGASVALTATASSGLAVSFASVTPNVCTVSGSTVTLSAVGTCTITASQAGAGQYGPAASVTQSFTVVTQVPTDLTSARFAPNCGAANVTQIFPDGFLASGQAGVNNLQVVSDPDVVLIGNQWWLIFASNPGPTRGIEPVAAYLPPGVSLSYTGIYPADPNGWHLVGANAQGTGKGVAIDGTVSPAGWDTVAAETPSIDVGPDGTVSVYYAGHNLGQTNFEIGLMNNVVNGVAASIDPVPAMVATQPWEFDNGLGAILEQSVRWEPELNKYLMYYTAKGWWDTPPSNDIAYAESTDGINWTNRQHLGFPVSYYNQDFVFNPQWNRYEMVVSNDPTGAGGSNGRDIVWLDSAGPGTSFSAWQNQVTLLDHTTPGTPTWRDAGLLSPAVKYGNLPGEENRIYVFFHAYGSTDPMSIARFYCDAITTDPGYTMTASVAFMDLAPGASGSMPIAVNPTNGFSGTVNFTVSGAPAGVTTSLTQSASAAGTTVSVTAGANTPQGRYPITVTGTSGTLTREATFTLNVSGQSQTITIQPLSPNNINYTPGLTYTINASASSGLPVTLSVGGNGTLNGNVLTVTGGGDIIIAANQAGNGTYSPAPQATTTLVVAPEVQTVNVAAIPAQTVGGTLDLSHYVSASSGLTVDSYTNQTPTVCTNNGSLLTFTNVGQCVIIAIQFGNQFYAPAGVAATVTVNPATQTITFGPIANQTVSSTVSLSASASSGLPVSFASSTPGVCTVSGSTASLVNTGTCTIVASQAGNGNYLSATNVSQSFTVAGRGQSQTITFAPAGPVIYGVAPVTLNATASSGLAVTFSVVSGPGSLNGNVLTVTGAGTIMLTANQAGNATYAAAAQVSGSIVVTPAVLTVTANNLSRAYGTANPALTYAATGFVNGDTSSLLTGAPALSTTATATSLPGSYPIAIAQGTLSAGNNYTLAFVNGTLQVTGTATTNITVTASPGGAVYGQSVGLSAKVLDANNNPVTGGTVSFSLFNAATNSASTFGTASVNPGTGVASVSVASLPAGAQTVIAVYVPSANYSGSGSSTIVTIAPAPITITVNPATKVYGAALPTLSGSLGAALNGDVLSATYTTTATAASPVATYPITATLTGAAAANYSVTVVPGTLSVTPATLTVTANSLSRGYGTANPTLTDTVTGYVNGDTASILSGAPSLSTTATTTSMAGSYPITIAQGTLTAGINYTFIFVNGALQVTIGSSTTSLSSPTSSTYGQQVTIAATVTSGGSPVTGGSVAFSSGTQSLGSANVNPATGVASIQTTLLPAGTDPVGAVYTSSGAFPGSSATGSIAVAPAPITITVNPATKVYGAALPSLSGAVGAAQNGDALGANYTTTATASSSVATYPITATLTGAAAANYSVTVVPATLSVTPAPLTIAANNATRAANTANPAFTYTPTGFVNGDTSTVLSGAPVLTTTAMANSSAGPYPIAIAQGTLSAGVNYSLTFVPGTLTVTAASSQTIAFSAIPNTVYGAAPFALSASASSGLPVTVSVVQGNVTLSGSTPGLIGGTVTVLGAGPVTLQASQAGNASYPAATPVQQSFNVAAAPLAATANAVSYVYGTSPPPLTGSMSATVGTDTFTESYTTNAPAIAPIPAGSYTITPSLAAVVPAVAANYSITYNTARLTVMQASTTTTLSALPANVTQGTTVQLTATVLSATSGTPTQTVNFYAGTTFLGAVTLNGGVATLPTSSLPAGSQNVYAVYGGDNNFTGSQSAVQTTSVVVQPGFSVTSASPTLSITAGQTGTVVISVTSVGGYAKTVTASCGSGLPSGVVCSFSPASLTFTGQNNTLTTTLSVATSLLASEGAHRDGTALAGLYWMAGLLGLSGVLRKKLRTRLSGLICLLVLVGVSGLGGCGSTQTVTATPGTCTVPVTLSDGTATSSVTVTVIINR